MARPASVTTSPLELYIRDSPALVVDLARALESVEFPEAPPSVVAVAVGLAPPAPFSVGVTFGAVLMVVFSAPLALVVVLEPSLGATSPPPLAFGGTVSLGTDGIDMLTSETALAVADAFGGPVSPPSAGIVSFGMGAPPSFPDAVGLPIIPPSAGDVSLGGAFAVGFAIISMRMRYSQEDLRILRFVLLQS